LIPSYLIFAIFLGCGLSAVRKWLHSAMAVSAKGGPRGLQRAVAWSLQAGLAVLLLAMPLYALEQNWAEVDLSANTEFRDLSRRFVQKVEPNFLLVESEAHYDDLEAIRYVAWAEKEWYSAGSVISGDAASWLGRRPVYAWAEDADLTQQYLYEPVPDLPAFVRLVGIR
jgi:hypothetical protein